MNAEVTAPSMTVTEAAAAKAASLLADRGGEAAIRVFVKSGGCSGYMYGMAIDDRRLEGCWFLQVRRVPGAFDHDAFRLRNRRRHLLGDRRELQVEGARQQQGRHRHLAETIVHRVLRAGPRRGAVNLPGRRSSS